MQTTTKTADTAFWASFSFVAGGESASEWRQLDAETLAEARREASALAAPGYVLGEVWLDGRAA